MRFIGELYKGDLIKLEVMLFCLGTLLEGSYEEEKIECFAKLISTVGFPLEQQSASMAQAGKPSPQQKLNACWTKVDELCAEGSSARIKFMLLDLKEMRDNGTSVSPTLVFDVCVCVVYMRAPSQNSLLALQQPQQVGLQDARKKRS